MFFVLIADGEGVRSSTEFGRGRGVGNCQNGEKRENLTDLHRRDEWSKIIGEECDPIWRENYFYLREVTNVYSVILHSDIAVRVLCILTINLQLKSLGLR